MYFFRQKIHLLARLSPVTVHTHQLNRSSNKSWTKKEALLFPQGDFSMSLLSHTLNQNFCNAWSMYVVNLYFCRHLDIFTYTPINHQNKIRKKTYREGNTRIRVKSFYINSQSKITVLLFNHLKCEWQTMMQFALVTELALVSEKLFAVHNIHFPSLTLRKKFKRYITCHSHKENCSELNLVNTTSYPMHLLLLAVLSG